MYHHCDISFNHCVQRSVTSGLGSYQAEIMADTAVALASSNVQLVSRKIICRLVRVRLKLCFHYHTR